MSEYAAAVGRPVARDMGYQIRAMRWYREGIKDGLSGVLQPDNVIPRSFLRYYKLGHTKGLYDRGL